MTVDHLLRQPNFAGLKLGKHTFKTPPKRKISPSDLDENPRDKVRPFHMRCNEFVLILDINVIDRELVHSSISITKIHKTHPSIIPTTDS